MNREDFLSILALLILIAGIVLIFISAWYFFEKWILLLIGIAMIIIGWNMIRIIVIRNIYDDF